MTMAESRTCPNGHVMPPGDDVCPVCGLPVDGTSFTERPAPPAPGRTRAIVIASAVVLVLAVVAIVVALLLTGGDDDGDGGGAASGTTSTKDFCGALKGFQDDLGAAADPKTDPAAYVTTLKEAADKLRDLGTPAGMPADAKAGFDLTVKTITELPDDATGDDLAKINDVGEADKAKIAALEDYIAKECRDLTEEPSAS